MPLNELCLDLWPYTNIHTVLVIIIINVSASIGLDNEFIKLKLV